MRISPQIASLVSYTPGKPIEETKREYHLSEVYKLASNENPLGPSPFAIEAVEKAIRQMHRYPDASCYDLLKKLSSKWSVTPESLAVGNGSNEIIDVLIRTFCEPGDKILTSEAAFICYPLCAQAARIGVTQVPLRQDYTMDLKQMAEKISHEHRIVFIPNPNNPTGTYVNKNEIEDFLKKFGNNDDLLICFDEAYSEFVRAKDYEPALNYAKKYKNVVVVRTMSKIYGLAALRVGFLLAHPNITKYFHRVRNPFNVNSLAQVAATAALDDVAFIEKSKQIVWQGLDYFYQRFAKMQLPYIPSQANFVMFDCQRDSGLVNESLLRRGVIMRPIKNYGFNTHLRVTVGLPEENKLAMDALESVLREVQK